MGAHFAAVQGVFGPHALFHESVAGLGFHWNAAGGQDHFPRVPDKAGVVDDFFARMPFQQGGSHQATQVIAFDELAPLVKKEAAVKVAVKGDAKIGLVRQHGPACFLPVFRQQRVGHAVGEAAVRLGMQGNQPAGQVGQNRLHGRPGAAVAGVDHHRQGRQVRAFQVAEQMGRVFGPKALASRIPALAGHGQIAGQNALADGGQAAVRAYGHGPGAHQLHAVPVRRVVAGRDHDAAVKALAEGGVVNFLGAAQAYVHHLRAAVFKAVGQHQGDVLAGQAGVPADAHGFGSKFGRKGQADLAGQFQVELQGNAPPDVVSLEAGKGCGHADLVVIPKTAAPAAGFRWRRCR